MGTGIVSAIPIILENVWNKEEYFSKGFFENYKKVTENNKDIYMIKKDILLSNYNEFLQEFYDTIGEEVYGTGSFQFCEYPQEMLENIENCEEFLDRFSMDKRNATVPFIGNDSFSLATLGCNCFKYFVFYSGSYKSILEEYSTLIHFEKILAKAMKNPLAKSVKFCVYG